jgi:hypothetical protein
MKTALILLFVITIMCTGCASVEQVELRQKDQWVPKAQMQLLNKDVTVNMRDGRTYDGNVLRLDTDSLCLVLESNPRFVALPLERVSLIQPSRNAGPPIAGFLGGLLVGGAAGAAIGASQVDDPPNPYVMGLNTVMEKTAAAAGGGLYGALIGSVALGTIVGAATAVTDYRIIYNPSPATAAEPTPPPPDSSRRGK